MNLNSLDFLLKKKKNLNKKMPMGDAGIGINSWDVDRIIHVSKPSEQVYNKVESKRGKESKKWDICLNL